MLNKFTSDFPSALENNGIQGWNSKQYNLLFLEKDPSLARKLEKLRLLTLGRGMQGESI